MQSKTVWHQANNCIFGGLAKGWVGLCIFLSVFVSHIANAIDIPDATNKLMFANEIDRTYVVPLGLKGKSAAHAMETLLGEGFRCRLQVADEFVVGALPQLSCVKLPSGFGVLCDELNIKVRFDSLPKTISRDELFRQLDAIKVKSGLSFCAYPRRVSAKFLAAHGVAEDTLRREMNVQKFVGNAKAAYDMLLLQGFYCGFSTGQDTGSAVKLVCSKLPSGIPLCFESKLAMDVTWPPEAKTMKDLFGVLPVAQVTAVRASCEIPAVEDEGRPL